MNSDIGATPKPPPGWWVKLAREIFVRADLDAGANDEMVSAFAWLFQCTPELMYESEGKPVSAKAVGIVLSLKMPDQVKMLNAQTVNRAKGQGAVGSTGPPEPPGYGRVMGASLKSWTMDRLPEWAERNSCDANGDMTGCAAAVPLP